MRKLFVCLLALCLFSCKDKTETADEPGEDKPADVQAPVTVVRIDSSAMLDETDLNATSSFLQSNVIKASANGYLNMVKLSLGQRAQKGAIAFVLKTKEAEALGNSINALDSSFRFSGLITIRTPLTGYVLQLNHQPGDYVQEGDQLAVIADANSFGFMMNMPYELLRYVKPSTSLTIVLPDSTKVTGTVTRYFPSVDSVSQTQQVFLKVNNAGSIPQNLIGKVRIVKQRKLDAQSLPKKAILSDEAQSAFWVMKMIDSTTAVKVPIEKGLETGDRVEIKSPRFSPDDKILLSGNYGLADTAHVKIQKSDR